jgi:hypothetical protein
MEKTNKLSCVGRIYAEHWQPKPIQPPKVDPELGKLTGVQRSAEVIRFGVLSLEWWLSPLGRLREWVRLNSKLSAVLLIPAVLVLPLILLITGQLVQWLALLISISGKLIILPVAALAAAGIIALTIMLLRAILNK